MSMESSAYSEGYDAWDRGLPEDANPYEEGSQKAQEWLEGWEDALADLGEEPW